jgi:ATP-dependent exoDNAse (exonuclease V) beta subunit
MSNLTDQLRECLAFDEDQVRTFMRLACKHEDTELVKEEMVCGALQYSKSLTPIHEALLNCVSALEWYDNVHRNHWAIDLNDLERVANEALDDLRKLVEKV